MKTSWSRRTILAVLAFLLAGGNIAYAEDLDGDDDYDHDRARHALEEGYARPLGDIMDLVGDQLGGQVVGIEFHGRDHHYIYEFKIITPDGELREVYVDALTGEILKREAE
jgi:uncharacterized membrane protein YkoI